MDISVECQGDAAVTKDGGQGFDVESLLGGIGRKCVAELVIIMVFYLSRQQYLLVAVTAKEAGNLSAVFDCGK